MADIAGLIVGGVALAGLFSSCIECFEYIQLGRNFGTDFQRKLLRLDLAKLKLLHWGTSVRVSENSRLSDTRYPVVNISAEDAERVKTFLGGILTAFSDAEEISRKFAGETLLHIGNENEETSLRTLHDRMRNLAHKHQKNISLKRKTAWAVHDSDKFDELIHFVGEMIDGLILIFPSAQPAQIEICRRDIAELDESNLKTLESLSRDVHDEVVHGVVEDTLEQKRHSFRNVKVSDHGMLRAGDEVAKGATISGEGNMYYDISVSGNGVGHFGSSFGGDSVFSMARRSGNPSLS